MTVQVPGMPSLGNVHGSEERRKAAIRIRPVAGGDVLTAGVGASREG